MLRETGFSKHFAPDQMLQIVESDQSLHHLLLIQQFLDAVIVNIMDLLILGHGHLSTKS